MAESRRLGASIQRLSLVVAVLGAGCSRPDTERPATVALGGAGAGGAAGGTGVVEMRGGATTSGGSAALSFGGASTTIGGQRGDCVNLECQQQACSAGSTTVSGTVYDPAGVNPLYGVMVYIPNAPVEPIATSVSCAPCGEVSGHPIASALSDTQGHFRLENVPVGAGIPLVIQVGKWRRQVTIEHTTACSDTPLPAALTRLPAKQSEGDLPRIALATGSADALECLLRRVGIADSEFTPETGNGRVHLYAGYHGTKKYAESLNAGAAFTAAPEFWSERDRLMQYDLVLLSCEGESNPDNKSAAALEAMRGYLDAGGRLFASHWHNYWLRKGPEPLPSVAKFVSADDLDSIVGSVDTSFPKGQALAEWLLQVGGSTTLGALPIEEAQHTVEAVDSSLAQRWIYLDPTGDDDHPTSIQYFSANTPLGASAGNACGRVVFSDLHVSSSAKADTSVGFPDECASSVTSPQEKALEFMLFDLSSCIIPDNRAPEPPPVVR